MAARNSACCCRTRVPQGAGDRRDGARDRAGLGLPHITSSHCTVTVSVGVAATLPNDAQSPGDLIEAADAALYAAKHRGRNTVVEHGFEAGGSEGVAGWRGGLRALSGQRRLIPSPTR